MPGMGGQVTGLRGRGAWYLVAPLAVTSILWVALFVARVHAHQPNTDDFGYAAVARHLSESVDFVKAFLVTGHIAALVPALAAPGVRIGGLNGAIAVNLPILLLLVGGAYVLGRVWLSMRAAMVTALITGVNGAVLGYSVMLNFALASAAAIVWCFASYLQSDRLRSMRWSVVFGIAVSALALARSIAPVYVVPLVLVVFVDLLLDARKNGNHLGRPAVFSVGIVFLLAGPWWLVSGPAALQYLTSAGYQPSSGFATHGAELSVAGILQRSRWELVNLGWLQSLVLGIGVLATACVAVLRRHSLKGDGLWMLAVWAVLTLLLLSTSTNEGTAFGLPLLAVIIVLCCGVLGQVPIRSKVAVAVAAGATLVVGVALAVGIGAQFSNSVNRWWPGPPYRVQVLDAGGTPRTNIDVLTGQVARAIGTTPTLMIQNDRILNMNGLKWSSRAHAVLLVPPKGPHETALALQRLPRAKMLISGSALDTFEPSMDQAVVEANAVRDGFLPVREWKESPSVSVVLWVRAHR